MVRLYALMNKIIVLIKYIYMNCMHTLVLFDCSTMYFIKVCVYVNLPFGMYNLEL